MTLSANPLSSIVQATAPVSLSTSELRWELVSIAIGVVLLSIGLAGLALFFMRRESRDRTLIFFSVFSLLYAIRLIFRQSLVESLVPAPPHFFTHGERFIDYVIIIPLILFLIDTVTMRWKIVLRWLLAFHISVEAARFLTGLVGVGQRPALIAHHVVIFVFCALLAAYPFAFRREHRLPGEFKVLYTGLLVFGLFVIHSNLIDLRVIRGRGLESIGFLFFVCCLGYVAAVRTFSKEERLLSIQKELEIARRIQSSILPREIPRITGLDIAVRYVPMTAVAGDFYDFIIVDEQRVGILVADVTGHGVPAALIASMLKVALAPQSGHAGDPAQVLAGLNHSLCGKFEEHFVTAAYLFVDTGKQIFRYAGAGHPPLLFGSVDASRRASFRQIESNGLLLGISDKATYCAVERSFQPGDRCLLYTDGALEARNGTEEEFGSSRLISFLETHSGLGAASVVSEFLSELARWSGRTDGHAQEDDITLIAIDFESIPAGS